VSLVGAGMYQWGGDQREVLSLPAYQQEARLLRLVLLSQKESMLLDCTDKCRCAIMFNNHRWISYTSPWSFPGFWVRTYRKGPRVEEAGMSILEIPPWLEVNRIFPIVLYIC
jgi:hypothetical protein